MTKLVNGCNITLQLEANESPSIEKFGQIPDNSYFDSTFKPILVKGRRWTAVQCDSFRSI